MVFRCPNIQAHYNEAVIYLNFGTSKRIFHLEQMENILFLGVPILKHIRRVNKYLGVTANMTILHLLPSSKVYQSFLLNNNLFIS